MASTDLSTAHPATSKSASEIAKLQATLNIRNDDETLSSDVDTLHRILMASKYKSLILEGFHRTGTTGKFVVESLQHLAEVEACSGASKSIGKPVPPTPGSVLKWSPEKSDTSKIYRTTTATAPASLDDYKDNSTISLGCPVVSVS